MRAVVRNGAARLPGDAGALASSVVPMNEMVRRFRDLVGCPLWQAVRMASLTPATILGFGSEVGSLAPGKRADILILDENVQVKAVWIGGRRLAAAEATMAR
jgi:N-acetylglucosamine-6-phosphate deacetylase